MRVVLLLDDDPFRIRKEDQARLTATHNLPQEIEALLAEPTERFRQALVDFQELQAKKKTHTTKVILDIAGHYLWAASWLNQLADKETIEDHVDVFFADQVLRELAKDLRLVGEALVASHKEGVRFSEERLLQLHRRLLWIFSAKVEIFERKRYLSLSHEPNKAMNLNSYIGLMGGNYKKEATPDGVVLVATPDPQEADLIIPNSDFLLTLDADSILLREYCLRLVYFLEQPDNANVAVVQTPYSSFRGASTRIERLAGATTDIQHIIHQGMSYYGATFG